MWKVPILTDFRVGSEFFLILNCLMRSKNILFPHLLRKVLFRQKIVLQPQLWKIPFLNPGTPFEVRSWLLLWEQAIFPHQSDNSILLNKCEKFLFLPISVLKATVFGILYWLIRNKKIHFPYLLCKVLFWHKN